MKTHLLAIVALGLLLAALRAWSVAAPKPPAEQFEAIATLGEWHYGIRALAFSPDGKTFVSAGRDGTVRLWDVANRKNTTVWKHDPVRVRDLANAKNAAVGKRDPETRIQPSVTDVVFSPDGKTVASADNLNHIRLWDVASRKNIATLKSGTQWGVGPLVFGPDGKTLAACEKNGIRLWDVEKRKELRYKDISAGVVQSYSSAKRPLLIVTNGTRGENFTLVDAVTFDAVLACAGHRGGTGSAAMDHDETIVTSTGGDSIVRLWDRSSGRETDAFKVPHGVAGRLAISPDGKIVALSFRADFRTGDRFDGFRLYEAPSGKLLAEEKQSSIDSLVFSPDGQLLASAAGGTIKLWSVPAAWRKTKK